MTSIRHELRVVKPSLSAPALTLSALSGGTSVVFDDRKAAALYRVALETAKRSEITIDDRLLSLGRVARFLDGTPLLAATAAELGAWQASIRPLTANTVRVYTTHIQQFYRWALDAELIESDPSRRLIRPRVGKGVPHPIADSDLETLFAICGGKLRLVFALAAFAGTRVGEVARLQRNDLDVYTDNPLVFIRGKGSRERYVPLLRPLIDEVHRAGESARRTGALITNGDDRAYTANRLQHISNAYLHDVVGTASTMHSLRHWYATNVARATRDPLLVRDLLGHSDLSTTQVYMQSSMIDGHQRLEKFERLVERTVGTRRLHIVHNES